MLAHHRQTFFRGGVAPQETSNRSRFPRVGLLLSLILLQTHRPGTQMAPRARELSGAVCRCGLLVLHIHRAAAERVAVNRANAGVVG